MAQLIDAIAAEYGWPDEYILDQPYSVVFALSDCIRVRKYRELRVQHSILLLAQPSSDEAVAAIDSFFESVCPKDLLESSLYDIPEIIESGSSTPALPPGMRRKT